METPEKSKTIHTTSLEKLQRSPVFEFIDNLSPIKPVKSSAIFRESIASHSFASFPSIFASPHEKSVDFSQRHHITDLSKPELSSDDQYCDAFAPKNFDASEILVISTNNVDSASDNPNPRKDLFGNEVNLENGSRQADENGWENNLVSDEMLFAFIESCEEYADPSTTYYQNIKNAMKNVMNVQNAKKLNVTADCSSISYPFEKPCYKNSGVSRGSSRRSSFVYPASNSLKSAHSDNINLSDNKKRRKSEATESCKRCNCRKSKCLKLYCECFAAGVYCVEPCACFECSNKPMHANTVITARKQIEARNPLAFAPKVVIKGDRASPFPSDIMEISSATPASARHKRGCNCKKSSCLKKYCECYQSGVGCSVSCRCENCKNAFGRNDGVVVSMEVKGEEEEEERFPSKAKRTRRHIANSFEDSYDVPKIVEFRQPLVLSPNGKRVSPPQTGRNSMMSSFSGLSSSSNNSSRRLVLTSIPSFPSLAAFDQ